MTTPNTKKVPPKLYVWNWVSPTVIICLTWSSTRWLLPIVSNCYYILDTIYLNLSFIRSILNNIRDRMR